MKYDFTEEAQPPLEFKIGPDVFYAVRDCPAGTWIWPRWFELPTVATSSRRS